MARVILNIEAESAGDLQEAIDDLARGGVPHRLAGAEPAQQPNPEPQPEQPQAEEKPKRKRRTKAEIEADKKAHDAKQAESQPQNTEPAADNGGDPGADVANTEAQPEQPTRQDVDAAMRALLEANGGEQMLGILRELGAINDAGHPKISALDEAKYAEAIQKAQAAVATLKEQADQAGSVLG